MFVMDCELVKSFALAMERGHTYIHWLGGGSRIPCSRVISLFRLFRPASDVVREVRKQERQWTHLREIEPGKAWYACLEKGRALVEHSALQGRASTSLDLRRRHAALRGAGEKADGFSTIPNFFHRFHPLCRPIRGQIISPASRRGLPPLLSPQIAR